MAWEDVNIPSLHFSKFEGNWWNGDQTFSVITEPYNIFADFYQNSENNDEYHTLYTAPDITISAFKYPYTWNNWKYGLRFLFGSHPELNLSLLAGTSPTEGEYYYLYYFVQINRETEDIRIGYAYRPWDYNSNKIYVSMFLNSMSQANRRILYLIFINAIPPAYNWQAVPSIVGKSAVSLDLSVILDINNGEAVTTSDASKFDLNNDSNVITLVNNVINQNE